MFLSGHHTLSRISTSKSVYFVIIYEVPPFFKCFCGKILEKMEVFLYASIKFKA